MSGLENILANGALGISITGMAIVFSGLVLISLAITWLPRILDLWSKIADRGLVAAVTESSTSESDSEEKDLASVIGLVMQMEDARQQQSQDQEDIDIANVIGLVLHLEHERKFAIPN